MKKIIIVCVLFLVSFFRVGFYSFNDSMKVSDRNGHQYRAAVMVSNVFGPRLLVNDWDHQKGSSAIILEFKNNPFNAEDDTTILVIDL